MVKHEERQEFFEHIVKGKYEQTKLIIVILDAHSGSGEHGSWEFACDNIIRLDYSEIHLDATSLRDYYIRQIEIIKARYQGHVWGKHQFKIYGPYELPDSGSIDYSERIKRDHPFREEGGIFIYPSIHFYLSQYKRQRSVLEIKPTPTPCEGLNELVEGFPEGRCTALIGCRGAHKSHLGYLHLLEQALGYNQPRQGAGIIISLRDDEKMTKQHLLRILSEKLIREEIGKREITQSKRAEISKKSSKMLNEALERDDLEILYYPPGYITADEFCHRMSMSVYRLRKRRKRVTLLFNSLDQISARFPLCAHQPILVPAIIECLSGEAVTSIFIAVDEPGQPPTQYGLLPMADLILTFGRFKIKQKDYYAHHGQTAAYRRVPVKDRKIHIDAVLLEVSRFAGGQQAGTRSLVELVYSDRTSSSLITEPGLHFKKWDYEYFRAE